MKFKQKVAKFFGIEPREVHIDPSSVNTNQLVESLQASLAETKAQRDKLRVLNENLKKSAERQQTEDEVKLQLNERKQQLEAVKKTEYFSLKNFFRNISKNPKLAGKLHFMDFDCGTKIDKFKDFGFSEDGNFVVVGDNGVILKMDSLKNIFWRIRSLKNDIPAGLIPLCLSKDGEWVENVMEYEIPEIQRAGNGLQYYKARKRPLYEIIADKNDTIGSLQQQLEEQEEFNHELQQQNDDLNRALRLRTNSSETLRTELSLSEKSSSNVEKAFRDLARDLETERSKTIQLEDEVDRLEEMVKSLGDKAEEMGGKTDYEKVLETVQHIKSTLVRDEPKVKVVTVPQELNKENLSPKA